MKKFSLLAFLCFIFLSATFGQTENDSITMKKTFGGYAFYQNEQLLNINQLANTMQSNDEAYKVIKNAQTNNTLAQILGGIGGFMIGYPVGAALAGGEPNWLLAGIGAGVIVAAIPVSQKANQQARKAVDIYNQKYRSTSFLYDAEISLIVKENRIGFRLMF